MIINLNEHLDNSNRTINVLELRRAPRKLSSDLIAPATEEYESEVAIDHSADPIKSLDDINRISEFLIKNKRYRDNMLFIVGINFGLRCSDLRMLRFGDLITDNFMFKDNFPVFEKKTRNTRKRKKNRYITINDAVIEAVTLYLENTPNITLSDYMFRSESKNKVVTNKPITIQAVNNMLNKLAIDLDLNIKMSSHTLRKTFCYWMMVQGHNDQRRLLLLQKILNHSSPAQTLQYIGITDEEISAAYKALNIGSEQYTRYVQNSIIEIENKAIYERGNAVG